MWKMLMLKKYYSDITIWTYPPSAYATISHHFRVPPSPSPGGFLFERPLTEIVPLMEGGNISNIQYLLRADAKVLSLWQGKQNVKVILPWRFASLTHLRNQKTQPFWLTETLQFQEVSRADVFVRLVSIFEIKIEFLNVIFHEKRLRSYP